MLKEVIWAQNEIISSMYAQEELDDAFNKAKAKGDMFGIPVREPCPE